MTLIASTPEPPLVEVHLSGASVERECFGDAIAVVNRAGNWIRGLELLGSLPSQTPIPSLLRGTKSRPD